MFVLKESNMKSQNSVASVVELSDNDADESVIFINDTGKDVAASSGVVNDGDDFFVIDTVQCEESSNNSAYLASEEGSANNSIVVSHLVVEETKSKGKKSNSGTCFNCMGLHSLFECREPRDQRRISRNRNVFMAAKRDFNSSSRIHESNETESGFKPGVLSKELREALGITDREIPEWIFRMRKKGLIYGYPPGYFKKACEKHTLAFKVGDDKNAADEFEDEVLDSRKIVYYPGFNVYDQYLIDPEKFRIPPWNKFVKLHESYLKEVNLYRKKALNKCQKKKVVNRTLEDGEIIDDDSILLSSSNIDEQGSLEKSSFKNNDSSESKVKESEEIIKEKDQDSSEQDKSIISPKATSSVTKGTPILIKRKHTSSGECDDYDVKKPSLENFAQNIVPFRHTNVTEASGFFPKMLSIIKQIRKN